MINNKKRTSEEFDLGIMCYNLPLKTFENTYKIHYKVGCIAENSEVKPIKR